MILYFCPELGDWTRAKARKHGSTMRMDKRCLTMIASVTERGGIGYENRLLIRIRDDLQRFKALTMGHYVLMGRRTYESLTRPLEGRTLVVLTHDENYHPAASDGVLVATDLQAALAMCPEGEIFVAGGAQLYEQTIGMAQRLLITRIAATRQADAYFPPIDESVWRVLARMGGVSPGGVLPVRGVSAEGVRAAVEVLMQKCA